jgi:hypothetical protein
MKQEPPQPICPNNLDEPEKDYISSPSTLKSNHVHPSKPTLNPPLLFHPQPTTCSTPPSPTLTHTTPSFWPPSSPFSSAFYQPQSTPAQPTAQAFAPTAGTNATTGPPNASAKSISSGAY